MTLLVWEPSQYVFSPSAMPTLFTASLMLSVGVGILARERNLRVGVPFFMLALLGSFWHFVFSIMYCATTTEVALWWARAAYMAIPFIPAASYHFTTAVLRIDAQRWVMILVCWLLSVLFSITILSTDLLVHGMFKYWWGYYPRYGVLSVPYLLFFFAVMARCLLHYHVEYRRATPGTVHWQRIRKLAVAFSIGCVGSIDVLAKFGIPCYPAGYVPVCGFLLIAAWAVWRYHLVDITPAFAAQQIINTMADGLLVLDQDGVVQVANRAASPLLGTPESSLVGAPLTSLKRTNLTMEQLGELLHNGAVSEHQLLLPDAGDGNRALSVTTSVIRTDAGMPAATICLARDITKHRQAEERLQRALADLKRSHEALKETQLQLIQMAKMESVGQLAAGIAHEVKNPLAIILMGTQYLAKHMPSGTEQTAVVLHDVQEAVKRADTVIKGLLDFSAPAALQRSVEDLHALIDESLALVKHELVRSQIAVVKRCSERPIRVRLDQNKFQQVLVNLFLNAVQAMPQGGTLTVTAMTKVVTEFGGQVGRRQSDRFRVGETVAVVQVDDTGGGIPPEQLERVFDPFFTTKPPRQGTGLGLTVSKSIIDLHGGTIELANRAGGGARVTLVLRMEDGADGVGPIGGARAVVSEG